MYGKVISHRNLSQISILSQELNTFNGNCSNYRNIISYLIFMTNFY